MLARSKAAGLPAFLLMHLASRRPHRGPTRHTRLLLLIPALLTVGVELVLGQAAGKQKLYLDPLSVDPRPIASDATVKLDYDIVYVRAPRPVGKAASRWAEVGDPRTMDPGADLVVLHPDGTEEVLVPVQPQESITDPFVSFDGQWVFFAKMHDALNHKGADIYKVNVSTRKVVQLTDQTFTPNTGAADWRNTPLPSWGVYNLGPTPVPGGRIAFVSDRNAFLATNPGYTPHAMALQLFVMDDDGRNVECIGHLNLGTALHPVILRDGRIMFSSLESQGLRSHHLWGIWAIQPDGTHWNPLLSAFDTSNGTTESFHFQTQTSDGSIVLESYYNLSNFGFGMYFKLPSQAPEGYPLFGPANPTDPRNPSLRNGRLGDGRPQMLRFPFTPYGMETLTAFVERHDEPAPPSILKQKDSPRVGKFTHPSGAPDNHLLTAWAPGGVHGHNTDLMDSGLYLIKSGEPLDEPGQMLLLKNDSRYNEQWPRALVPYRRIYGIEEPPVLTVANDGGSSPLLPEGTPFGLVGSSSLYKRESYPYGVVPPGKVTAAYAGGRDAGDHGLIFGHNWRVQGADAGAYQNDDIHAIRIVILEPSTAREGGVNRGPRYFNHAHERMRILGEFPVRHFQNGKQLVDPDGNPDTSFQVKVPADVAWTFQTLDRNSMVLNAAQTWHQVRPGEVRHDCGGCHAHSQKPTRFEDTAAARADYAVFDPTRATPLLTSKALDQSGKRWDVNDETGLRFANGPLTVEYHRDVKPILERSCVACHTQNWAQPAGRLVLDDEKIVDANNPVTLGFKIRVPGTYKRLAADAEGTFGVPPLRRNGWANLSASRYVRAMQARRSLLIWKIFGGRLDGFDNDDFVHEMVPGDPTSLRFRGQPVPDTPANRDRTEIAYTGGPMPPPEAIEGTYVGPDGKTIKVPPLSDEDLRTLVRWVDLGCPIDLDFDPKNPLERGYGWALDDGRPTLTVSTPRPGANAELRRIVVGMYDYGTGIDPASITVKADFPVDGAKPGEELAPRFKETSPGVRELTLATPVRDLERGTLTIGVKDRQGNVTRIERTFSVGAGDQSSAPAQSRRGERER
jgi:hydrazine synthase alpha subunit-like protein